MDRCWLLTWCTYGSWLPGDARGFVGPLRDESGRRVRHNVPGTPCDADVPALEQHARGLLKCAPIRLRVAQAVALWEQFLETANHRDWQLLAVGIMANHVHVVVGVPGDPDPTAVLRDLKSYGSRRLNRKWAKPPSDTWWTESGSKRKLPDEDAVLAAIRYVMEQEYPLLVWTAAVPELGLLGGRIV